MNNTRRNTMIRKTIFSLIILIFTLTGLGMAFAADGPDGNKRKGKYTYRKVCKACFDSGEVASETPAVSPSDKKMNEWKNLFESRSLDIFGCPTQWDALSEDDYLDIYAYFYYHASDSPTPATCK